MGWQMLARQLRSLHFPPQAIMVKLHYDPNRSWNQTRETLEEMQKEDLKQKFLSDGSSDPPQVISQLTNRRTE